MNKVEAQELPFVHYTPNNEVNALPSAMATNVFQDSEGFVWMSVFSTGLVRFDGTKMDVFDQEDGLRDLGVWQIVEDGQGYLWVSSNAGLIVSEEPLVSYRNGRRVKFTDTFDGNILLDDALTLNQIGVDQNGHLWVGTIEQGFVIYQIDQNSSLTITNESTQSNGHQLAVNSVFPCLDGSVLAGLEGGKLARFRKNKFELLYSNPNLSNEHNFVSLYEDKNGRVWGYKQNGQIVIFDHSGAEPRIISEEQQSNIASISSIDDEIIWAINGNSGIAKINFNSGEKVASISRANGLLSDNVFHVFKDREQNIWIAQSGGVSKLRFNYNAFENYSARSIAGEKPILPSAKVNSILVPVNKSNPCKFLVATEGGLACVNQTGSSIFITQNEGLVGDWVNGFAQDLSGRIWIATTQGLNGLVFEKALIPADAIELRILTIFGKVAYLFTLPNSPPFIAAEELDLFSTQRNAAVKSAWFPGLRSLCGIIEGQIFNFGISSGLPSTLYKAVAFDAKGFLWVGTLDRGIFKSTNPITLESLVQNPEEIKFESFWSREMGGITNHIEKMLSDQGKMWIGTQEGLMALDIKSGDLLHQFNKSNGLPADNAMSFSRSPITNHFWIGTNQGLAEFDPEKLEVIKTVTRQDGLIDNEVWLYGSVQLDAEGQVYFGTANGLSVYDPQKDQPNPTPPIIQLTLVEQFLGSEGKNEIVFEYAAMSFANIPGVRYQTRLIGYDDDWSVETTVKRLRYTNLSAYFWPKEYTLEVRAFNDSGLMSEDTIQYSFKISPVIWMQWWMMLIYLLLLGVVFVFFDRFQRNKVIKKERDIARLREAELQAETATARSIAAEAQANALKADNEKKALELQKVEELERAYNELKSAQNQLIQAEKMASLGRLATGIAHEIKNPLNFINNFASVLIELVEELEAAIKSEDMEEIDYVMNSLRENTERIEKHGKRADSIVQSMMQHARGTKSTFELFNINSMIEKYVDLAYNGKRNQVLNFYVKIEYNLDKSLPNISIVGQEIGQVLLNIIGNSLDAVWTYKKSLEGDYEPIIYISTAQKEKHLVIKIEDNGPGVPEEIREKIFEPFFTTKPTGEGTGLGLSLSYDIITQGHNGTLVLDNTVGKGASFIITLPLNG